MEQGKNMQITLIGLITIILTIIFFKNSAKLFSLLVFLSPFTASSIFILTGTDKGMQPAYFIGLAFIFRTILKLFMKKVSINAIQKKMIALLSAFWLLMLGSLLFPLVLNVFGIDPILINARAVDITRASDFPSYSCNYFIYMTLFLAIAISTIFEIDSFEKIKKSIQVLSISAFFSAVWGLFVQLPSFLLGYDYPIWIFNNHQGYGQSWNNKLFSLTSFLPRINSIFPEPSMYAVFLMAIIVILFVLTINKIYIFRNGFQVFLLIFLLITSWLSTSTTAYIGSFLLLVSTVLGYLKLKRLFNLKVDKKLFLFGKYLLGVSLIALLVFMSLAFLFIINISDLLSIFRSLTFDKVSSGSGQDRADSSLYGLSILFDTYFLGTGWGYNRTNDLLFTLLSNVGLFGFLYFAFVMFYFLKNTYAIYKKLKEWREFSYISLALFFSLLMELALMLIAVPDFIFIYFWIILGLLLSLPKAMDRLMENKA